MAGIARQSAVSSISSTFRMPKPTPSTASCAGRRPRQGSKKCRCCAAGSWFGQRRRGRRPQAEAGRGVGAPERPRNDLYRRGVARLARGRRPVVGRKIRGSTGRLVRATHSGGSRPQARRSGDDQRARPQYQARISNMRTVDWQSLGINFVMVFPPNIFPRRAAYPHGDDDLSGRRLRRAGGRKSSRRSPNASRPSPRFASRTHWKRSAPWSPIWCSVFAQPAR